MIIWAAEALCEFMDSSIIDKFWTVNWWILFQFVLTMLIAFDMEKYFSKYNRKELVLKGYTKEKIDKIIDHEFKSSVVMIAIPLISSAIFLLINLFGLLVGRWGVDIYLDNKYLVWYIIWFHLLNIGLVTLFSIIFCDKSYHIIHRLVSIK